MQRPLAHRAQAKVAGEILAGVETSAIVGDFKRYLLGSTPHLYPYLACTGVFDGIVEDFLDDAVDGLFGFQWGLRLVAEIGLDLDSIPGFKCRNLLLEGRDHSFGLQRLGPQLED